MTSKKLYYWVRCGNEPIKWCGRTIQAGSPFPIPEDQKDEIPASCHLVRNYPMTKSQIVKQIQAKKKIKKIKFRLTKHI